MWYELPLHALMIVGVRRADGDYDVTVKVTDRMNHRGRDEYELRPACAFRSESMEMDVVTARIAEETSAMRDGIGARLPSLRRRRTTDVVS